MKMKVEIRFLCMANFYNHKYFQSMIENINLIFTIIYTFNQ